MSKEHSECKELWFTLPPGYLVKYPSRDSPAWQGAQGRWQGEIHVVSQSTVPVLPRRPRLCTATQLLVGVCPCQSLVGWMLLVNHQQCTCRRIRGISCHCQKSQQVRNLPSEVGSSSERVPISGFCGALGRWGWLGYRRHVLRSGIHCFILFLLVIVKPISGT